MAGTEGWQKALELLEPLDAQIDIALSQGDVDSAMRLAFGGAVQAASSVREPSALPSVHKVYVELTPLPFVVFEDGTLADGGVYVNLIYQCWDIAPAQVKLLVSGWNNAAHWTVDSA